MATEEALVVETAVWPIPFLINMFTAPVGPQFYFYLLLLQLVLCCVAALKITVILFGSMLPNLIGPLKRLK